MSARFKPSEELDRLLSALSDGQMTVEQEQRLAEILRQDPQARSCYLDYLSLNTVLQWEYGEAAMAKGDARESSPLVETEPTAGGGSWWRQIIPLPRRKLALGYALAAAAAVAILLLAQQLIRPIGGESASEAIARLVSVQNVRWAADSRLPKAGRPLSAGLMTLEAGQAVFEFRRGARLTLSGPARLELESGNSACLHSGVASVRAPEAARGFILKTPASDFVDLGTEFGVVVNPDTSTEVHVFDGMVVARPRSSEVAVTLYRDEAGRIDSEWGEVVAVEIDPSRFPALASAASPSAPAVRDVPTLAPLPPGSRLVFLGDRATDRETHLLFLVQALAALPAQAQPQLFNAGESFPFFFTEAEFEQQVLRFRPTHAVLEFGTQLALDAKSPSVEEFAAGLTRLLDRLQAAKIEPVLATAFPPGARFQAGEQKVAAFNTVVRRLAAERDLRLADEESHFRAAAANGPALVAENGIFPTPLGHREIASAILEALGYPGLRVDGPLRAAFLPGVIREWKLREWKEDPSLDADRVARLQPDEFWTDLSLPQVDSLSSRVPDSAWTITYRDRARGFATHLRRPGATSVIGLATIESKAERDVFFNIGASLRCVWLNGVKVYDNHGRWTGWHAGKERIAARLKAGTNTVVIEAKDSFFLSVTDRADWPLPAPEPMKTAEAGRSQRTL